MIGRGIPARFLKICIQSVFNNWNIGVARNFFLVITIEKRNDVDKARFSNDSKLSF